MITLFRVNTYFHVFSILVVLLLLKVPFISMGLPTLQPELEWLLVGERLNEGKSLYSDIWTKTGPLTAYVYGFVYWLFGRDQTYYELFALVLAYFQSLYFAYLINSNRVIIERNYLPALMYAVVISLSFDLSKLTPALMANTFLLMAVNSIFKHIDKAGESSEHVFEVGLMIGIGSLFLYSFPAFFFWAILSLIMFSPFKGNQVFLMLLGFVLPLFVAVLFFYFNGTFNEFYHQWILQFSRLVPLVGSEIVGVIVIFLLPTVFAILGSLRVLNNVRYSSFQNRKHQILILLGVFALLPYFLSKPHGTYHLIGLAPFLAFYLTGWFIFARGAYLAEVVFLVFLALVMLIKRQGLSPLIGNGLQHLTELRVNTGSSKSYAEGKRILVTGDTNDDYFTAKAGSPFVNWEVSKGILQHPDTYQNLALIYETFKAEKPDYIIDNEQVFPEIFDRIPELSGAYERVEGTRHFRLKY
ncbi:hypothetical protein [Jiulongibacter sediminis]|uniref:hypothetical protein n=1 Tax=Jiulongibacter sediminis TaxID=1605367 RepID=UPI0026EA61DE|nr:hypothetical protein [Jiulongibacter sediminis]